MSSRKASPLRRHRHFLTGCVACVFIFGILSAPTPKHEVFPFFCWFLFSITPGPGIHYSIEITHQENEPLSPSQPFQKSPLVQFFESSTNADRIIQNLGRAIEDGNEEEIERFRDLLENNYFRSPVRYRVLKNKRDPLQYQRTGISETSVLENLKWKGSE